MEYCQEVKERRSPCPVACTLDLIGDKWTLLIVRDLLRGKTLFKEFSNAPERIATNILTERLVRLVDAGLVTKEQEHYRLTERGRSLKPVLGAVAKWGMENLEGTKALLAIEK